MDPFSAALLLIAGLLGGALAGVLPGIHSNTLQSFLPPAWSSQSGEAAALLITSLACSRLAFEAIPSILLFIPGEETVASMLPGQRLAQAGKAAHAIRVFAFSTLASAAFACAFVPLAMLALPGVYESLRPLTPLAVLLAVGLLIFTEKTQARKLAASACVLFSGALGLAAFSSGLADPFLPGFTGLFAIPAAAYSLNSKNAAIPQAGKEAILDAKKLLPFILAGVALGALADLFPGMGSAAQVSILASLFIALDSEGFLSLSASVSSAHLVLSFAYAAAIGKARTGAAAAAASALGQITPETLPFLLAAALAAASISSATVFIASRRISGHFSRIDAKTLSASVLLILPFIVFSLQGPPGLALLLLASITGALPHASGARRVALMGFILVPSLWHSLI